MIPQDDFRALFKDFTGPETFRKFVKELYRNTSLASRLRFWQQDLWESFLCSHPDCTMTVEELQAILRICELHEIELIPVEVPSFRGCIDYAPDFLAERASSFPHARLSQVMVSESYKRATATIWYCPACDEIQNQSRWSNT